VPRILFLTTVVIAEIGQRLHFDPLLPDRPRVRPLGAVREPVSRVRRVRTLGVVALNELLSPALYRLALVRCGEEGRAAPAACRAQALAVEVVRH